MKIYLLSATFLTIIAVALACKFAEKKRAAKLVADYEIPDLSNAFYPVSVKGKWGYINNKMDLIIQPRFYHAEDFSEGLAAVSMQIKIQGDEASMKVLQGFIDTAGKLVVDYKYDKAGMFSEGLAWVSQDGKYGFIDKKGREIIPLIYEESSNFSEGLAVVKLHGKNGFVDLSGKMVIQPQFERSCWVSDFSEGLSSVYTTDETAGYIDKTGKFIIQPKYNYAGSFSEGLALVQLAGNNKYGYISRQGEMAIEPKYELSLPFSEGVASVKVMQPDGKVVFNIIDKTGKSIGSNLEYNFVGIFREGLAGVESYDHLWGFIDVTGREVIKPQFAGARLFRNGLSRIETGSLFKGLKTIYLNKKGRIVWQE